MSKKWADEDALTTDTDPPLSPEALLSRLRTEFKVDGELTDAEARKLVGLRYCLAVTKLNQLSTAAIASDISVELIAELKDGACASTRPTRRRTFSAASRRSRARNGMNTRKRATR